MGVVVVGTGVATPTWAPWSHGARHLADAAVQNCLGRAGYRPDRIDLLVNVGVYRERGLGEPALAALIQQDVSANAGQVNADHHGTFSFDVDNGACGVLTAADLVRGFLSTHAIHLGVVVASDSGPDPVHAHSLPKPEAGAALLLDLDGTVEGLSPVRMRTFPEYAGLLQGYWEWQDGSRAHRRSAGANRLVVVERPGFAARASECAAETVATYLAESGTAPEDVDLLIATPEPEFADRLAALLGVDPTRTLHPGERLGRMHTAQPIAAIDHARRTGRWASAHTILLVSAGSGLTVAVSTYRH